MKIEDFGFQPVMGKEYVVSFTKEGELLSTSVYNGSDLPPVSFPDNAKIVFTVTDKETGKQLMNTEFISYNGKLYKSVFKLPLKNPDTNKNANVYIKDLHYDLTTGSVLVQVQGFKGDKYNLSVSDTTVKHKVMATPIVLEDDMYYSIPTELVQGNNFEVLLQDEYGKSVDYQEFTAPISTDWRFTATLEDGTLVLDGETPEGAQEPPAEEATAVPDQIDETTGNMTLQNEMTEEVAPVEQTVQEDSILPDALVKYEKPIVIGSVVLIALLLLILVMRMLKKRKPKNQESEYDEDDENDDLEEIEDSEDEDGEDELEEVEIDDENEGNKKPKK